MTIKQCEKDEAMFKIKMTVDGKYFLYKQVNGEWASIGAFKTELEALSAAEMISTPPKYYKL